MLPGVIQENEKNYLVHAVLRGLLQTSFMNIYMILNFNCLQKTTFYLMFQQLPSWMLQLIGGLVLYLSIPSVLPINQVETIRKLMPCLEYSGLKEWK